MSIKQRSDRHHSPWVIALSTPILPQVPRDKPPKTQQLPLTVNVPLKFLLGPAQLARDLPWAPQTLAASPPVHTAWRKAESSPATWIFSHKYVQSCPS